MLKRLESLDMLQGQVKCNRDGKATRPQPLTASRFHACRAGHLSPWGHWVVMVGGGGRKRRRGSPTFNTNKPFSVAGGSGQRVGIFRPFCTEACVDQPHGAEAVSGPRATARTCGCSLVPAVVPGLVCNIYKAGTRVQTPSAQPHLSLREL